ncbi:hypothetical protein SLEP1_g55070 [Rubroshorea leprosula]|uniref:Uncharacterized protein n=1 Tax=Rubroshorea leprosula TaxID=152421 RepID=A0AAV5MF55_9ROSI|nr:hypothetical protein SLEP1_g55070 [Rubroshorea leprosula]
MLCGVYYSNKGEAAGQPQATQCDFEVDFKVHTLGRCPALRHPAQNNSTATFHTFHGLMRCWPVAWCPASPTSRHVRPPCLAASSPTAAECLDRPAPPAPVNRSSLGAKVCHPSMMHAGRCAGKSLAKRSTPVTFRHQQPRLVMCLATNPKPASKQPFRFVILQQCSARPKLPSPPTATSFYSRFLAVAGQ